MIHNRLLIAAVLGVIPLTLSCQKKSSKAPAPADDNAGLPLQGSGVTGPNPSDPSIVPAPVEPTPETPTVPTEPQPPVEIPTELKVKEKQFWVYGKKDDQLAFNTPWDEEEGDAIDRDGSLAPEYAKSCLKTAEENYAKIAATSAFKTRMQKLLARGVTPELTFLVVTVDNDQERDNLRKLDRDAYFWQWTDPHKKPVLGMNVYSKGTWVWEVIASPGQCLGPAAKEISRFLDYTVKRLDEKGVKS